MIDKVSGQLDSLIEGDFSKTERPKGNSELINLYDKVQILGDNFFHSQSNLENQRNQLDSVLTYMVDGIIATDRQGNIILANHAAQNQLNMTAEELLGKSLTDSLNIKDKFTFYDLLEKEPELVIDSVNSIGEAISLRTKFVLFRRESGFISGIIAVLHDTTAQEKNEREQKQFVSNVSHELRTPLTSVKAYLEALEDGALEDPEVARSFIGVSLNETNRMIRMISDLLTLSRIDQERLVLNKELINFVDFLTFQTNRLARLAKSNPLNSFSGNFQITTDFPEKPIWIEIDTDKITQVIDNIVGNALKYSPQGGEIHLTLSTQNRKLIVEISDQGIGIPKSDLPKIFSRFYRVDQARNSQTGGTGLGLSIVKNIIELHGGTIVAASEGIGKGTTFTLTLPYSEDLLDSNQDWDDTAEIEFE
ncbi:Histidine kinase [Lactococcus fujiensis JCM 16395]|uniref:histidine kinase n=2 Tax=Lactococcus fujiensis TaxID=610251 RepID=A0A2A5RN51_9LACT|nr:Histidine kinase [Lactococcus fujiensis JCM 16395]